MIELQEVSKKYPTGQIGLYNVDLTLRKGEMAFLTGHSGAGKSTLLKLIALLERPTQGNVLINGFDIGQLRRNEIANYRRSIGIIFQDHHLLSDRTVYDNVALPLMISGMRASDIERRVHAALDKVNLMYKQNDYPLMLSAGEKQRVGIARAVVNKPSIILADEPTGNLDPGLASDIMQTFLQFNDLGSTILIASHDHSLIERMGKRIISLQKVKSR
ncbi:MAG: cell division ATP-binding protein FtsE [Proteobacteria bacterium]|nr:MAG: cell division ATP-binding protein FtsE [Pseudomonadota bacterium]